MNDYPETIPEELTTIEPLCVVCGTHLLNIWPSYWFQCPKCRCRCSYYAVDLANRRLNPKMPCYFHEPFFTTFRRMSSSTRVDVRGFYEWSVREYLGVNR